MPFYQVPRTVLHQEVVRLLLQQIKEEIWLPGEQLPSETEFAERFGVSRNCIREALKALSFSGIVCSRPGQGTFLTKDAYLRIANYDLIGTIANCSSISDLMETRIIIESQLAGLAAKRATDEDIQLISSALEELKADLLAQINSGTRTNPTRSGYEISYRHNKCRKKQTFIGVSLFYKGRIRSSKISIVFVSIQYYRDDR